MKQDDCGHDDAAVGAVGGVAYCVVCLITERDAALRRAEKARVATLDECATQLYAIIDEPGDGSIRSGIVCGLADRWGYEVDAAERGPQPAPLEKM